MCFRSTSSIDSSSDSLPMEEIFCFASTRVLSAIPRSSASIFYLHQQVLQTFNSILKFPDIPWPMMRYNRFLTIFRKRNFLDSMPACMPSKKCIGKSKISSPLSFKGGTTNWKYIQPIIKVFSKVPFLHLLQKVSICCG